MGLLNIDRQADPDTSIGAALGDALPVVRDNVDTLPVVSSNWQKWLPYALFLLLLLLILLSAERSGEKGKASE